ncbi:hypothetical protein EWM64_g2440 [Hericium alpestre]|uniref:Uncharacterized protein n=1 Tax=Hericium alpestre TaxID=135208 RepID=A0A4Z0A3H8_9AGAM|nr:hypothetical protein EWM64_g2440 [Hericium alpestre]
MLRYTNSKLFPFPGIIKLEEERNRARGFPTNVSSPDIVFSPNGDEFSVLSSHSSQTPQPSPEVPRDHKLSHQASDTRLLAKFSGMASPPISTVPSSGSHPNYFTISSAATNGSSWLNGKLPTNREGVKKWLSAKKLFSSQSSSPEYPSLQSAPPVLDTRPKIAKKPSLSDLLKIRKDGELSADWDDLSKTPTSASGSTLLGKGSLKEAWESLVRESLVREATPQQQASPPEVQSPPKEAASPNGETQYASYPTHADTHSLASPPDLASSASPDPVSSADEYPIRSSLSSSSVQSPEPAVVQSQSAMVLECLDELLNRGSRGAAASFMDDPPRKLLLSSPVLQVANTNTVKDRFLFLFNDILVITKPIMQDQDSLLDTTKRSPLNWKFIIKSVIQLRNLRFSADRDDSQKKSLSSSTVREHPVIRSFVLQFSREPDQVIAAFLEKTNSRDDLAMLGADAAQDTRVG